MCFRHSTVKSLISVPITYVYYLYLFYILRYIVTTLKLTCEIRLYLNCIFLIKQMAQHKIFFIIFNKLNNKEIIEYIYPTTPPNPQPPSPPNSHPPNPIPTSPTPYPHPQPHTHIPPPTSPTPPFNPNSHPPQPPTPLPTPYTLTPPPHPPTPPPHPTLPEPPPHPTPTPPPTPLKFQHLILRSMQSIVSKSQYVWKLYMGILQWVV